MNRPLALIEGNLAFPKPKPFDGLPPPFGSRRQDAQTASQHLMPTPVQRSFWPAPAHRLPPRVRHILFYKAAPKRAEAYRFDAEMAEAKRYLEMGSGRPCSTRSDHLLAASIFAGCTIALTGLLMICSTKDTAIALKSPARQTSPKADSRQVATVSRKEQTAAPLPFAGPTTHAAQSAKATQTASYTEDQPKPAPRPAKRTRVARLTGVEVGQRIELNRALTRAVKPAARPTLSQQPEWTARQTAAEAPSIDETALLKWADQQRRSTSTTRATVPVPTPGGTDWNSHMTQRRITDNPDAFQANGAKQ
ncbi:hypothetical protein PQQ51_06790 [Paraburkholderia xenovorans]|uniref:hypothetical protein n=1 Tax=Paraburkholderia xenovorans TaxID=36873 RepID=UPI0038B8E3CD